MAAFFVPHECLSGAKIGINTENSKLFSIFFRCHKKNKGAQALKTCVPYVLSYYNKYAQTAIPPLHGWIYCVAITYCT